MIREADISRSGSRFQGEHNWGYPGSMVTPGEITASTVTSGSRSSLSDSSEFDGRERLRASSTEFRQEVIKVTDGVFAAVGYSASNVTSIQGGDGSVIVDTSANPVDARAIVAAFGDRMVRPVLAIIYTHNRPDDSGGAKVFTGDDAPQIYAHQLLVDAKPEFGRGPRLGGMPLG